MIILSMITAVQVHGLLAALATYKYTNTSSDIKLTAEPNKGMTSVTHAPTENITTRQTRTHVTTARVQKPTPLTSDNSEGTALRKTSSAHLPIALSTREHMEDNEW